MLWDEHCLGVKIFYQPRGSRGCAACRRRLGLQPVRLLWCGTRHLWWEAQTLRHAHKCSFCRWPVTCRSPSASMC